MSIRSEDFLRLAGNFSQAGEEVILRASAGQAYLGAYHSVQPIITLLPQEMWPRDRTNSHDETFRRLVAWKSPLTDFHGEALLVSNYLETLKGFQIMADFHLDREIGPKAAQASVVRARRVAKFAEDYHSANGTSTAK